jgi:inorganic pyrophosphatase
MYCHVEAPKGSRVTAGVVVGEPQPVVCPADWGYVPDTLGAAGGPLEAIVCVSVPGPPGGTVAARPVALVHSCVSGRPEIQLIVCVAADERDWATIETADQLPRDLREEIAGFVACRHPFQEGRPAIVWGSRDEAMTAIDDAAARWAATVNGRG